MKFLHLLTCLLFIAPLSTISAQDSAILKHNFGAEMGGPSILYSLYYERMVLKKEKFQINLKSGIVAFPNFDTDRDHRYFPSHIAGLNFGSNVISVHKKHAWEFGITIGYQYFWGKDPIINFDYPDGKYIEENWMHWLYISPSIGYRRYSGNNKFYFRAAFTPIISLKTWSPPNDPTNYGAFPWTSIGFGYAIGKSKW